MQSSTVRFADMGYISSSASVSSSYSANRVTRFKDSQEALASALDNKYLKRRSQIEHQRRHSLELCGGSGETILHLTDSPRNRQYLVLLLFLTASTLSSFWFLAGWVSASYGRPSVSEEKSLQDLADSIRRMRLRRNRANKNGGKLKDDDDGAALLVGLSQGDDLPEDVLRDQTEHNYYDHKEPPEPLSEFEYPDLQGEAARVQRLEARIRETQDRQVKEELRAKRLEDSMADNLKALKDAVEHEGPQVAAEELEEESFS